MKLAKKLCVLGLFFTIASGAVAKGKFRSAKKNSSKITIGLAVANLQADFFSQVKDGVIAASQADGNKVIVVDAHGDGSTQVNQVEDLLTKNINALIYISAGASGAAVPVQLARSAGIPVICIDRNPETPGDTFIASDSVESARQLGEWVIKKTGGTANIAIIHGQMGTTPEIDRTKGWMEAMKGHDTMKLIAENAADWDQAKAFTLAQDMLQKDPSITVFFGECDTMAMGAARAVQLANLNHKVLVVGFDGDVAALKELKKGLFDATCTQQTQLMGKLAYTSALKAINGEKLPPEQLQIATLTTAENVDEFIKVHP
jgi:ribose transport system substrate-binding protein